MKSEHLMADIPCKAFVERDGKILFVQEADGPWALPGGRIHVGEMPREALKREIREELGVDIEVGDPFDVTVFTSKSGLAHLVVAFHATIAEGQELVADPSEVAAIEWVGIEEILTRTMHIGSRSIIERLAKRGTP
ncbi:NUDIX hydrolase [Patescibacteria group bacterium]|nr:MAG: NUDIX hydrolase [Patescibacteria group bacterium]